MLKVDLEVIKPFIDATLHTFKNQCQFEASAQAPYLKGTKDQQGFDIVAIIGLTSPTLRGSISLCFPTKVFLTVMNGMLNESFKEITRELEDGAAELLNIIYGEAKHDREQFGWISNRNVHSNGSEGRSRFFELCKRHRCSHSI
jgi:chemotaxis protein CheX